MDNGEIFVLEKEKKYVIYGSGGDGRKVTTFLTQCGCAPVCVIDKRAAEIKEMFSIPVVTLQDYFFMSLDPQEVIIIITLKNVFAHTDIARILCEKGYDNIIYKPMPLLQGAKGVSWDSIGEAYELMIAGEKFPEKMSVQKTKSDTLVYYRDCLAIETGNNEKKVWMPLDLLHNYDTEEAWGRIGMSVFFPMVELFQCLLNVPTTEASWEECRENYLLYCGEWLKKNNLEMTEGQRKSFIESRVSVFWEMQRKYDLSGDFFLRVAPRAKLGERNCFFLSSSGRNRVAFQAAKGSNYVPVTITETDYRKWVNEPELEKVKDLLFKQGKRHLFASVPHPILADYPIVAEDYNRFVCREVLLCILKEAYLRSVVQGETFKYIDQCKVRKYLSQTAVGIWAKDEGAIRRYLYQNEVNHIDIVCAENTADHEWAKALDQLLNIEENSPQIESANVSWNKLDYLVVDSRVTKYIPKDYAGSTIFLIYWEEDEIMEHVDWKSYKKVKEFFFSIWDGRIVKGYVLKRLYEKE